MRWRGRVVTAVLLGAAAIAVGWAAHGARVPAAPAVAIGPPGFDPPAAGSYQLERILHVPDGAVLDSDGSMHRLREFTTGKITLFSFIYTYCTDARGCPLAYATLHALKEMATHDPALDGKLRLVSMSFDPDSDTPATMRSYGGSDIDPAAPAPWHFLTTASRSDLAPLLAGFGQNVTVANQAGPGQRAPIASHLLKVYLLDRTGTVREIYSTAFLHPLVLRNDVLTLLDEQG